LTQLSPGAIQLPRRHLSVRVPWNDLGWTGVVCAAPAANHACTVLPNVAENKDADAEEETAGRPWTDLLAPDSTQGQIPPCVFERGGFMRSEPFTLVRTHRYTRGKRPPRSHQHFAPTPHRMPAWTFEATPFEWVRREPAIERAVRWGIDYAHELEERHFAGLPLGADNEWTQDHRNQLAMLDSFFSAIVPGESIVFAYVKDLPLIEDRFPGARYVVGVGRVRDVGPSTEWRYSGQGALRSVLWERALEHSIRPDMADGFLLPYHELLDAPAAAERDLSQFVAQTPQEHFDEFSFVTEHVTDDAAIAALDELARVVELLPGVVDGPWPSVSAWLSDRIADVWRMRGPWPGLGAVLTAAGLERGALLVHRVAQALPEGDDIWAAVDAAIDDPTAFGLDRRIVGRTARKAWAKARSERLDLIRLLARFPLSAEQARRAYDTSRRPSELTDGRLIEDPYLLFEADRHRLDAISLGAIDRGLFPRDSAARASLDAHPLPEPVDEAADDRRVRAAAIAVLDGAHTEGHTVLHEQELRARIGTLRLDPQCDPGDAVWDIAVDEFVPSMVETSTASGERAWQLAEAALLSTIIRDEIMARVDMGPLPDEVSWRERLEAVLEEDDGTATEAAARAEKVVALSVLARSRISCLVGPAGTGKTTMLDALCGHPDIQAAGVLLLAPTGKARVQLAVNVAGTALTLAQFLSRTDRFDGERYLVLGAEGTKLGGWDTVVVDESSMLTEQMLASLIDALDGCRRLILVGDHRQLPPIGAGRPFFDLVRRLEELQELAGDDRAMGGGLAHLTVQRRQRRVAGGTRDDTAVAALFATDRPASPAADDVYNRVVAGRGDGTVRIVTWNDPDDLNEKLSALISADHRIIDADGLKRSLGATGTYTDTRGTERPSFPRGCGGSGAERWQVLTPVRARPGGVAQINRLVRATWRAGDAHRAHANYKLPAPMGPDEILFHDKVMCLENEHRGTAWSYDQEDRVPAAYANGETGMAVGWQKPKSGRGKPGGLWVELSSQPGLRFTFWRNQIDATGERSTPVIELAYGITIHKSQGSQFNETYVVVPQPCQLLSPELLYTALTRQTMRTTLLVQGDPAMLRGWTHPSRSETARRLTCLFSPVDPTSIVSPEGAPAVVDGKAVHRTTRGLLVKSKSEVAVANILHEFVDKAAGSMAYEQTFTCHDGSWLSPDFTIDLPDGRRILWEHLGMLLDQNYDAHWADKLARYQASGVMLWPDTSGPRGILATSTESVATRGIDTQRIAEHAAAVLS
jgi:hypothetical protein